MYSTIAKVALLSAFLACLYTVAPVSGKKVNADIIKLRDDDLLAELKKKDSSLSDKDAKKKFDAERAKCKDTGKWKTDAANIIKSIKSKDTAKIVSVADYCNKKNKWCKRFGPVCGINDDGTVFMTARTVGLKLHKAGKITDAKFPSKVARSSLKA